jgi:hypothetical protein
LLDPLLDVELLEEESDPPLEVEEPLPKVFPPC